MSPCWTSKDGCERWKRRGGITSIGGRVRRRERLLQQSKDERVVDDKVVELSSTFLQEEMVPIAQFMYSVLLYLYSEVM